MPGSNAPIIYSAVRVNLLGGWTDQPIWPDLAAVSNVSIGWSSCYHGQYPLLMDSTGRMMSRVQGHGSGLGISSIWMALQEIQKDPGILDHDMVAVILNVLEREQLVSKGGWQDQVGGIVPGVKLTVTSNHKDFHIRTKQYHPALEHMVLFDTGKRRPSAGIGDVIRTLIEKRDPAFFDHMHWIVYEAIRTFDLDEPEPLIKATLRSWKQFCRFVPQMDIPIKLPNLGKRVVHGSYLAGAGGGGFGITWVVEPGYRHKVVETYRRHGIWAEVPIVINSPPLIKYK